MKAEFKKLAMPLWSQEVYGRTEALFPFELPVYLHGMTWELRNRLEFICYKHNFLYQDLAARDRLIEDNARFYTELASETDKEDEMAQIGISRGYDRITNDDFFNRNIKALEDQETVISLFTAVEHLQSLLLKECQKRIDPSIIAEVSNWKNTRKEFKKAGVVCEDQMAYQPIVELNKVNNKIKHLGIVDAELAGFPNFRGMDGKPIGSITLELQDYLEAVHNYIFGLIYSVDSEFVKFYAG
ncbi:hypothetical protein A0256_00205 [Mucilaginibacter sp. PAMC 26640]|nr:hypothetical protein A0256_00205 [Mucilaginibacter sp. PAMC 26640]